MKCQYHIKGKPIPLKRPRFGKGRAYDSQKLEKHMHIIQLLAQHSGDKPTGPVKLIVSYVFQLPRNKKKQEQLIKQKYHIARPDLSNLIKFTEDVLVDANILKDDSFIAQIQAQKIYSEKPQTIIEIEWE